MDFTEARDSEWQWHQLGHMQVCTSLQTDNHASIPPQVFYRPDALPAAQPTASKHWRQEHWRQQIQNNTDKSDQYITLLLHNSFLIQTTIQNPTSKTTMFFIIKSPFPGSSCNKLKLHQLHIANPLKPNTVSNMCTFMQILAKKHACMNQTQNVCSH